MYTEEQLASAPGNQPIRVFFEHNRDVFEDIKNRALSEYPKEIVQQIRLQYRTQNIQPIGPNSTTTRIELHDTFLSFLWIYCYGFLIAAPHGQELTDEERRQAYEMFGLAKALTTNYVEWDKEKWPNPEKFGTDPKQFVGKTNAAFHFAFVTILFHEFAHIVLGHHAELPHASQARRIEMEKEADKFAVDKVMSFSDGSESYEIMSTSGIIAALNSLTFFTPSFNGGGYHPDPDVRITEHLEEQNYAENNPVWGFAAWALLQWQIQFSFFGLPNEYRNFKQYYYAILGKLQEFKKNPSS